MSKVERAEWADLKQVPEENYTSIHSRLLGLCEVDERHGWAHHFWRTADGRALAVCNLCDLEIVKEIGYLEI
jgi:hypothetical protein